MPSFNIRDFYDETCLYSFFSIISHYGLSCTSLAVLYVFIRIKANLKITLL